MANVNLHMEDTGGDGRPVVLIHGWPLSGKSWQHQISSLTEAGYRVITYDRRGFGESDKPSEGYNYDTFADDLAAILEQHDLQSVTLVGFSMGGGEIARYIKSHGEDRLHSVVFASAVTPYMLKTADNPDGPLDESTAKDLRGKLEADPAAFYEKFTKDFFSANADGNVLVSAAERQAALDEADKADLTAALGAMDAWATTDFRDDLTTITVPTLVIHGDADGTVPFEGSGKRTHEVLKQSELYVVKGGPHGINASHADAFNQRLIEFLSN